MFFRLKIFIFLVFGVFRPDAFHRHRHWMEYHDNFAGKDFAHFSSCCCFSAGIKFHSSIIQRLQKCNQNVSASQAKVFLHSKEFEIDYILTKLTTKTNKFCIFAYLVWKFDRIFPATVHFVSLKNDHYDNKNNRNCKVSISTASAASYRIFRKSIWIG